MKNIIIYYTLLILNFVLPFLSGVVTYYKADQIIFGQTMELSDLYAASFLGGIFYLIMMAPLSWLSCYVINKYVRFPALKLLLCPISCAIIGVLPVALISGGRILMPEAQLFLVFFITSGLVFGLLFLIRTKVEKILQI